MEPYARFVFPFKTFVLQKIEPRRRSENTVNNNKQEEATDVTHSKPDLKNRPYGRFSGPKTLGKKASTGKPALSPLPRQSSFNVVINPRKRCSGLCARMDLSSLDRKHVVCPSHIPMTVLFVLWAEWNVGNRFACLRAKIRR